MKSHKLLSVPKFEELCQHLASVEAHLESINDGGTLCVKASAEKQSIQFRMFGRDFSIDYPAKDAIKDLEDYCSQYGEIKPWQQAVVVDGKADGGFRTRWESLIRQIDVTNDISARLADKGLGKVVDFAEGIFAEDLLEPLKEAKGYFDENGKLPFMFSILHKTCDKALKAVRVSGKIPSSSEECELAILTIELRVVRNTCNNFWKELLVPYGVSEFLSLGPQPERVAVQYTNSISRYLNWTITDYAAFSKLLKDVGFSEDDVCGISEFDSDQTALTKRLTAIDESIPVCCDVCMDVWSLAEYKEKLEQMAQIVTKENRVNSDILQELYHAISARNIEQYRSSFGQLVTVYDKYNVLFKRNDYLKRLRSYAPDWVEAINKREGIHGESVVRSDIIEAWKWRQLSMLIEEITSTPLSEYQAESRRLSRAYRKITADYAEKSGWYRLLLKTEEDLDLQQALQGWRALVKKIGKGTGKRAPKLKAEARQLMGKCQNAVPAWIMPIHKAMENLNPAKNIFDVVIVDEASQSDISSLAILYMGKKLIGPLYNEIEQLIKK